jgi:hypothetical protein
VQRDALGLADFVLFARVAAMVSLLERRAFHESGHVTAALVHGVGIVAVHLNPPQMLRARYRAPHDCGLETIVQICLAGPESEILFCGAITDGADYGDYAMAREYLARHFDPLQAAIELQRCRIASERLVRGAQQRIAKLAAALLRHGTLSGEEIFAFC